MVSPPLDIAASLPWLLPVAALTSLLLAAPVEVRAAEVTAVAIAPVEVLGLPDAEGELLRSALEEALAQAAHVQVRPAAEVVRAIAAQPLSRSECLADDSCLADLGRAVAADIVLTATVAGLGDTRLVRSRLVRCDTGLADQDLQETVEGGKEGLRTYAEALATRLLPAPPRPWYSQWWLWTAAGAAAVALTAGAAVIWMVATAPDEQVVHVGDL